MADEQPTQLLDLDEVDEGSFIQLEGKQYRMKAPDEFSMAESARIRRMVRQMQSRLDVVDDLEIAESSDEFDKALGILDTEADRLLGLVLDMPAELQKTLKPDQRMRILAFFTQRSWAGFTPSMMSALSAQG